MESTIFCIHSHFIPNILTIQKMLINHFKYNLNHVINQTEYRSIYIGITGNAIIKTNDFYYMKTYL